MKSSTWMIGLLAVGGILAGVGVSGMFRSPDRLDGYLGAKGLSEAVQSVGSADARLTDQISRRIGLSTPPDHEIDLANPTEQDIRFLMDTFRGNDAAARRSAARALITAQEARAVGLLLRASGTPEELSYYCAGALEILRYKTREDAAELMIDVLEDHLHPPALSCRGDLESKLAFIGGGSPETLQSLLSSDRPRVQRYVLEHLSPTDDGGVREHVKALASSTETEVASLARKWLEQPVAESRAAEERRTQSGPGPVPGTGR